MEDFKMSKTVRKEWEQYLFETGKEYPLEEAISMAINASMFLINKGIRISENLFLNYEQYGLDYRLSESEKATYAQKFNEEGYATHDCRTIVKVMDAIYHAFNITMDEAYVVAQYAVDNHLTLTQAILDRFNVDFNEIEEFIDTVLSEIVKYFESRTKKYGKELAAIVDEVLSSLE